MSVGFSSGLVKCLAYGPLLLIHSVIGWFLGAVAWRTCGRVCAASGMGATTQRKKLAYNDCVYAIVAV